MVLGVASSSWEMWKMGWMARIKSSSCSVNECEPTCTIMAYGLRFFSESFLDGQVDQKYLALT